MKEIDGELITERSKKLLDESRNILSGTSCKPEETLYGLVLLAYRKIAELQLELELIHKDPEMHKML